MSVGRIALSFQNSDARVDDIFDVETVDLGLIPME